MRFDIPEQKRLVHQMLMPMRWGDMDAMGLDLIAGGRFDEYPNS